MLVTCDRCGESIFLEYTRTDSFDGGYTRIDQFEKAPEGWTTISGFGKLCPKCSSEANNLIESFMKG